jgi:hypothetical protein
MSRNTVFVIIFLAGEGVVAYRDAETRQKSTPYAPVFFDDS